MWRPPVEGYPQPGEKVLALGQKPTPEAHRYGVGSRPCLQLRKQVAHMGLHRLFAQEEALADFAVDQALRDQLQYLDLAGSRLLLELPHRRRKRDDLGARGPATRCRGVEPTRMVDVPAQNAFPLRSVHELAIDPVSSPLYPPLRGT